MLRAPARSAGHRNLWSCSTGSRQILFSLSNEKVQHRLLQECTPPQAQEAELLKHQQENAINCRSDQNTCLEHIQIFPVFFYMIYQDTVHTSTYYLAAKHDMCQTNPEWTLPQVSGGRLSSILMLAMASLSKQSGYKSRIARHSSPLVAWFLKVDATLSAAQCFHMQSTSCIGPSEV